MLRKIVITILTLIALAGCCLCMAGEHADIQTQTWLNLSGIILLYVAGKSGVVVGKIIEEKEKK